MPSCPALRPSRLVVVLAVAFALLLPGAAASAGTWKVPPAASTSGAPRSLADYESRVVIKINAVRHAHGLRPVRYFDSCLDKFSEKWARHLADSGRFEHRDQTTVLNTCHQAWVGEALVRGTGISPEQMVRAWLRSPPHRAILLKARANRAGVGVVLDRQGRYVGVLNFGDAR